MQCTLFLANDVMLGTTGINFAVSNPRHLRYVTLQDTLIFFLQTYLWWRRIWLLTSPNSKTDVTVTASRQRCHSSGRRGTWKRESRRSRKL